MDINSSISSRQFRVVSRLAQMVSSAFRLRGRSAAKFVACCACSLSWLQLQGLIESGSPRTVPVHADRPYLCLISS